MKVGLGGKGWQLVSLRRQLGWLERVQCREESLGLEGWGMMGEEGGTAGVCGGGEVGVHLQALGKSHWFAVGRKVPQS